MVEPESALIQLRKIVRPAPVVGPYRSFSAACWTDDEAFITVCASPKASDAPKPVTVWRVDAPLIVAVSAARAGTALLTSAPPASARAPAPARGRKRARRRRPVMLGRA